MSKQQLTSQKDKASILTQASLVRANKELHNEGDVTSSYNAEAKTKSLSEQTKNQKELILQYEIAPYPLSDTQTFTVDLLPPQMLTIFQ